MANPKKFHDYSDKYDAQKGMSLQEIVDIFVARMKTKGVLPSDVGVKEIFINHPTQPTRTIIEFSDDTRADMDMIGEKPPTTRITINKASRDLLDSARPPDSVMPIEQKGPDAFELELEADIADRLSYLATDPNEAIRILIAEGGLRRH